MMPRACEPVLDFTIPFPIKEGAPVVLEGEFPISEASWEQIMTVLAAMKPLLTRQADADPDDAED